MATLAEVEAQIVATLRSGSGLGASGVRGNEPLGVIATLPCVWMRWLGPTRITDAETGGGQDVTHAWEIGIEIGVIPNDEEKAQDDLKALVQPITAAVRAVPRLGNLVDQVRLVLTKPAEYFRRASLSGEVLQGPVLYGCGFRLEIDWTET